MSDNCGGGINSTLQVVTDDCACVSIKKISWNANDTLTITLTNGQSYTSPVLLGPEGPAPTIEFRVSGTYLQVNINDTGWTNLVDLTNLTGVNLVENDVTNHASGSTGVSTLKTFNLPADSWPNVGHIVTFRMRVRTDGNAPAGQSFRMTLAGQDFGWSSFNGTGNDMQEILYSCTRIDANTIRIETKFYINSLFLFVYVQDAYSAGTFPLANKSSFDFSAAMAVVVEADSVVAGDVILELFEIKTIR